MKYDLLRPPLINYMQTNLLSKSQEIRRTVISPAVQIELIIDIDWKEGRKEGNVLFNDTLNTFYLRKEGNVLFNDALNTFYLRLYGIKHMVKDHSDS